MAFTLSSSGFPLMIIPIVAIIAVVFIINICVRKRSCDNLEMSSTREASHQDFPNPHQINKKAADTIALDESFLLILCLSSHTFANSNYGTFHLDKTWPDLSVTSLEAYGSGVAIDNKNNVVVLHRGNKMVKMQKKVSNITNEIIDDDVILILDPKSGKIKASWGKGKFVKPHGIEITKEGDLFLTDVRLHQVFKFRYDKKTELWDNEPILSLGERWISGDDHDHFCSPADVAVMPLTGDFLIADGYCNSRIVKFNIDGKYLSEFYSSSSDPNLPSVAFNVTHAVAIAVPCKPHDESHHPVIFVADRNNGRVQAFSENGDFLYEIEYKIFGGSKEMLLSFDFSQRGCSSQFYGTLYAINGHLPLGQSKVFEILVSNESYKLVSSFALSNASNVELLRTETPHDIKASGNGQVLYVIEAYENLTLKKFLLQSSNSGSFFSDTVILRHCTLAIIICLIT